MPRYTQKWNEDEKKFEYVEQGVQQKVSGVSIHGPSDDFVSPIDGSIVRGRSGLRDHCRKHGVVPASEFTPEFYAKKEKERAKVYRGEYTAQERWQRKAEINEVINRLERG